MNHGPHLLINLLLVVGGILAYDTVSNDATDIGPYASMPGELTLETASVPTTGARAPEDLEVFVRETRTRLEQLEDAVGRLGQMGRAALAGDTRQDPSTHSGAGLLPGMAAGQGLDAEGRRFDEGQLETLRAYLAEIARRKHAETQRQLIEAEIARQDLSLTRGEREAVVAATLAYRNKAADLMRKTWTRDERGRAQRREAFENLRAAYRSDIDRLVSADAVERIMNSPLSPAHDIVSGSR